MKYIIFKNGGLEHPVIFDEAVGHEEINCPGKVVAAGFCRPTWISVDGNIDVVFRCYGRSQSLGIFSREGLDEDVLNRAVEFRV